MMDDLNQQFAMILFATAVLAVVVGWLLRGRQSNRRLDELGDEWQIKLDNVVRQRDRLTVEIDNLRSSTEAQHAIAHVAASRPPQQTRPWRTESSQIVGSDRPSSIPGFREYGRPEDYGT